MNNKLNVKKFTEISILGEKVYILMKKTDIVGIQCIEPIVILQQK